MASSMERWSRKGHLFVVADGMGAHAAGELASKLAIDHIPHLYAKYNDDMPAVAMQKAVQDANAAIHQRGQANEEFHNMGTTCSVLNILPQGAVVAHIGDSRVYRYSQNKIEQLTFDHSLVWEMKAAGQLTDDEEKQGKVPKNVITRSLGPYAECKVDLEGPFPVQAGDTFLLCSDGLTAVIEDSEIGSILGNMPPKEATKVMVDLANLRGGPDNITVIIVKITHSQLATTQAGTSAIDQSKNNSVAAPVWIWIALAVSFLLAILLFSLVSKWLAIAPAVAALVFLIWGIIKSFSGGTAPPIPSKPLGKGPYMRMACSSGEQFSGQLAKMIDKIQKGAQDKKWAVDWPALERLVKSAEAATAKNDHSGSIRFYGRAVSFLMDQLRNQNAGDSSVEL